MDFPFPSPPPEYPRILFARWLLVAWATMGVGIVIARMLRWKSIHPREIALWWLAAGISGIVAVFGYCHYFAWDRNEWLLCSLTAALSVSVAGITAGLSKLYVEGPAEARRDGFALTGALGFIICIAWFVVLLDNVPPAVNGPRSPRKRRDCRNVIRNDGLALLNYEIVNGAFPGRGSTAVPVSWRVSILPALDHAALYREYEKTAVWDQPPNEKMALTKLNDFTCPSNYHPQDAHGRWFTAYSMPTGPHTVGQNPNGTKIQDITDGTSQTLLLVEACGAQIIWTEPRDVNVSVQETGINLNGSRPGRSAGWLSSYHEAGVINVVMADGSTRFISAKTDPAVLKKLATIDGGEDVGAGDF